MKQNKVFKQEGEDPRITVVDGSCGALTGQHLASLANSEIDVSVVPNAVSSKACAHLAGALLRAQLAGHGVVGGLDLFGVPFFTAHLDDLAAERYAQAGRVFASRIRTLAKPFGSPLDTAVALLADAFPGGAAQLCIGEKPAAPGIVRVYAEGAAGVLPHRDNILTELGPEHDFQRGDWKQFGWNIALSMPESGGEFGAYGFEVSEFEYKTLAGESYGIQPDRLPPPRTVFRPNVGDFFILNTRNLHVVLPSSPAGRRITLSGFFGISSLVPTGWRWA